MHSIAYVLMYEEVIDVKKILFVALVAILVISCFALNESLILLLLGDPNVIADNTFEKVVDAISEGNYTAINSMFSASARKDSNLSNEQVNDFLQFVEGEIVTYSSASETGVVVDQKHEFGKEREIIQSSFRLETTEQTYYIAIIECRKDTFEWKNAGVTSIYIINAQNWEEDYIFRGEKVKTPGIHILD